jgi:tetratricopeptide (TPR) repeat protein
MPGGIGGGNRPGPGMPGGIGGGNRPGIGGPGGIGGGNRPGIGGGNLPGAGNRPGIGSGNIGSGNTNIGSGNTNINRPNFGGNTVNNNYFGNRGGGGGWGGGNWGLGGNTVNNVNINNTNINNHVVNNGWGGGGWRGGFPGGAAAAPFYGNWYRGGWGNSGSFLAGFGTGALTTFGLSAFRGWGGFGGAYPAYGYGSMGMYNYFPSWGVSNFGSWGLGSVANTWINGGYANPYYANVVAAQPAQTTIVYDYSRPINVTAAAPDQSVADNTEQIFAAARDSFKAGDYQHALDLADQVLKQTPDVAVVHEFRGLCLFALQRYDEAAAVQYAVLTAGPGWNWTTLVGLYPDVDTYTNQLRALEAYGRSNPNSSSAQFVLAYLYLVQGDNDAAGVQFQRVSELVPGDKLSASFAKLYTKAKQQPTAIAATAPGQPAAQPGAAPQPVAPGAPIGAGDVAANAAQPATGAPAQNPTAGDASQPPPPPPPALVGTWKAQAAPDVAIALSLQADGKFTWEVDTKGQKQTLNGQAGFDNGTLALLQQDGPPLVGKVTQNGDSQFVFAPAGAGDKNPGLTFNKSPA